MDEEFAKLRSLFRQLLEERSDEEVLELLQGDICFALHPLLYHMRDPALFREDLFELELDDDGKNSPGTQ